MSTHWKRLRTVDVRRTDEDRLLELADALEGSRSLPNWMRADAAYWLRRLAGSDKAMKALTVRRGAPRRNRAFDIAMDYAAQKELQGKAAAALSDVAQAWRVTQQTVKDAWSDHRTGAQDKIESLIVGRDHRSRQEWLRDISADLRERGRAGQ